MNANISGFSKEVIGTDLITGAETAGVKRNCDMTIQEIKEWRKDTDLEHDKANEIIDTLLAEVERLAQVASEKTAIRARLADNLTIALEALEMIKEASTEAIRTENERLKAELAEVKWEFQTAEEAAFKLLDSETMLERQLAEIKKELEDVKRQRDKFFLNANTQNDGWNNDEDRAELLEKELQVNGVQLNETKQELENYKQGLVYWISELNRNKEKLRAAEAMLLAYKMGVEVEGYVSTLCELVSINSGLKLSGFENQRVKVLVLPYC